jgi:transmembrane sensor
MKEIERMELAADWLQRLQSSPQDEALLKEWLQWCQSNPENLAAFDRVRSMWDSLDNPTVRKIVQEGRSRRQFRAGGSRRLANTFAIAATVLIAVGAVGWFFWSGNREIRTLATDVAQQDKQILSDGSKVDLSANTRIVTHYSKLQRSVDIDAGEAFFQVKKDPGRPFVVQAGPLRVIAVGTAFSVRRALDRTIVTVSEGVVRIEPNDGDSSDPSGAGPQMDKVRKDGTSRQIKAAAGDQVTFIAASNRLTVDRVDPKASWPFQEGVLRFVDEPLKNVVAEINRHRTQPIILTDAPLADQLYTGTVYQDRIDDWLGALQRVFPVRITKEPNGEVRLLEK